MNNELAQRDRQIAPTPIDTTTTTRSAGKVNALPTGAGVADAARAAVLSARREDRADTPAAISALAKLVTRPQDAFAAEGFIQTGVMVPDLRVARAQFTPLLAGLTPNARAAYDAVIKLRRGDSLQALLDAAPGGGDLILPELQYMFAVKAGRYDFKGGFKLIPKTNALLTVQERAAKLKTSAIAAGWENGQRKFTQALADATFDVGKLPPPFDRSTVKLQSKLFDLKNLTELKIATIALKLVGELPVEWVMDLGDLRGLAEHFTLVVEGSVEHGVTPADLGTIAELKELTAKALAHAAELVKWRDKVQAAEQIISQLGQRKAVLEELVKKTAPKFVRGVVQEGAGYRAAQQELTLIVRQLRQHGEVLEVATANAGRLGKLFGALHGEWMALLSRMSPILLRFRGPVTEWVCARLAAIVGSRIFGAIHPLLLIAMIAYDLAYLIKFLIDLCRGKLTYVGLGKGDYEPSLLDWDAPSDKPGDGKTTGDATGGTTPDGKKPEATTDGGSVEPKDNPVAKLEGPRARLARLLMGDTIGEKMTPAQSERLVSIIQQHEVSNADVDELIKALTPVTSVDQALDLLEKVLTTRKLGDSTDTTIPRETTGGATTTKPTSKKKPGDADRKPPGDQTGAGGGGSGDTTLRKDTTKREPPIRNLRLGAVDRDGKREGRSLSWTATGNTATIVVGRDAGGGRVTATIAGRVKLVGPYIEFHVAEPGLRQITFQIGTWDKATKTWSYEETTGTLFLPPVLRKYAPGKQPVKAR